MLRIKHLYVITFAFLWLVSCGDGTTKSYWDDGSLKSALRYEDGRLNGECCWYYANGNRQMQAEYKDDLKHGHSLRWYENGSLAEDCWYKAGELDSVYRSYSGKGNLALETYYVDGKLNGKYMKWYDNGQVYQDGQYVDGMMDGAWYVFYPEGTLAATAVYDRGKGKQTGYDETGFKCLEVSYLDNQKHGKEIHYASNGRIVKELDYEHGKLVSEADFH